MLKWLDDCMHPGEPILFSPTSVRCIFLGCFLLDQQNLFFSSTLIADLLAYSPSVVLVTIRFSSASSSAHIIDIEMRNFQQFIERVKEVG